jgi:hypothetical protein
VTNDITVTFSEKLYECDKHVEKINTAKRNLHDVFPLTEEKYSVLGPDESSFIDQLVFRFSKLQDTMGENIFPGVLILAAEDVKRKTFIDILNRLEELELIDKNQWLILRETRNEIAHEYSQNQSEVISSRNDVYMKSSETIKIYEKIKSFCKKKLLK